MSAPAAPPASPANDRIAKNAGILMALTMVSRVGGLVRDFCITHVFGASATTDVFYMAFTIPNVLRRLVAEGTLANVVQPAYQRVRSRDGDPAARRFFAAMLGYQLVVVLILTSAGIVGAPALVAVFASGFVDEPDKLALTVTLTRWLFPVVIAMSLVGIGMAALNAHDVYAVPALAPIVLNVSIIAFTVGGAAWLDQQPIFGVVAGVLVGGLLQVLVQLPALARLQLLVRPRLRMDPDVKDTLMRFVPGLFGIAVYQLNVIVLRQLASWLEEGSVSYYYTADRLMELAIGVFAVAIAQGAFSTMNEQADRGDVDGLKATWRYAMVLTSLVAIPAALGLAAIATPVVSVLFLHGKFTWRDVEQTVSATIAFAPGLVAISATRATAQVFFALRDQRTPVIVSALVLVANLALGLWLMRYGVMGLAATLSTTSFLQAMLLGVLLRRKLGGLGLSRLWRPMGAQLCLAVPAVLAAWSVAHLGDWPAGATLRNGALLAGALAAAVGLYGVAAVGFRLEGVEQITGKLSRRWRRASQR